MGNKLYIRYTIMEAMKFDNYVTAGEAVQDYETYLEGLNKSGFYNYNLISSSFGIIVQVKDGNKNAGYLG